MSQYHIFYTNSTKEIAWSSISGMTDEIKNNEKTNNGYDYVLLECPETPIGEKYYINSDATAIATKTTFSPSFSTTTPALDATVTVSGVPAGTEVFLEGTSAGTMSDTTLTFTATEAGNFEITFKKDKYLDYITTLVVKRYGE